jgi:type IV secretion system protein VirB10
VAGEEKKYERTPEEATGFETEPRFFQRKKVLQVLCAAFVVVIGGGLLLNTFKGTRSAEADEDASLRAANTPADFLRSQMNRRRDSPEETQAALVAVQETPLEPSRSAGGLPEVAPYDGPSRDIVRPEGTPRTVPPGPSGGGGGGGAVNPALSAYASPLIRQLEGTLLGAVPVPFQETPAYQGAQGQPAGVNANDYLRSLASQTAASQAGGSGSAYAAQNAQDNKQGFYDSAPGGAALSNGSFLGPNSIWTGTIIPGILETGINTDLPGNILARVTENIYDSQTGRKLLVPQGTLLVARYNSSVSYAQHRVQIVWDTLIRPDGFQMDLGGMNAVDKKGMSGQLASYHENWFEYLKAAGIITAFSLANSKMAETAAQYASSSAASAIAESNAQFVNQMGGNIVNRAMNIQPTLTVDSGTLINIMLNKTLYLPALDDYPVTKPYRLE